MPYRIAMKSRTTCKMYAVEMNDKIYITRTIMSKGDCHHNDYEASQLTTAELIRC